MVHTCLCRNIYPLMVFQAMSQEVKSLFLVKIHHCWKKVECVLLKLYQELVHWDLVLILSNKNFHQLSMCLHQLGLIIKISSKDVIFKFKIILTMTLLLKKSTLMLWSIVLKMQKKVISFFYMHVLITLQELILHSQIGRKLLRWCKERN